MFLNSQQPLEYTPLVSRLITETVDVNGDYTYSDVWYDRNDMHFESEMYMNGHWQYVLYTVIGGVATSITQSEYDFETPVLAVEYDDDMNEAPPHQLGQIILHPVHHMQRVRCCDI